MVIAQISDEQLIAKTKSLAHQERELLTQVLHHLGEIERRRLFAKLKYKSLYDYAIKELGYSDDQAYRRIAAARLLRQAPEIESKIEGGTLTLASLSLAATAIRQNSKAAKASTQEVRRIVSLVEGKSKREAEAVLIHEEVVTAKELRPEKVRQVGDSIEIRMTITSEFEEKIRRVKSLLAHSHPNMTTAEVFEFLCDRQMGTLVGRRQRGKVGTRLEVVRSVWAKAHSRCENCGGNYALEVDHIYPKAKGGSDREENLRLLCRSCNQRSAIQHFGAAKMQQHLKF